MTTEQRVSTKPRVILAALAFDETGELALLEAARLAEQNPDSELHAVHVVADGEANRELQSIDIRLTGAPDEIQRRVELMWTTYRCNVVAHVRSGRAAKKILETASDLNADLIVVGTHRRAGLEKLVLGSVALDVLHDAPCPVLIAVPKSHEDRRDSVDPACPACVSARTATGSEENAYWCKRHARTHVKAHVYEPRAGQRNSVMPTY